jgi:hypothetical protein
MRSCFSAAIQLGKLNKATAKNINATNSLAGFIKEFIEGGVSKKIFGGT